MANVNTVTTSKAVSKVSTPPAKGKFIKPVSKSIAKPIAKKLTKVPSEFDMIIIGAGGSGLAAAMYAARLGMTSLTLGTTQGFDLPIGGVITTTHVVENYPGFITLTGPELGKNLEINISDNSIGVKEEHMGKLFVPFFTTKLEDKKGTGLGLYVIRQIIEENHGGKIKFTSKYEEGSNTQIILPII